MENSYEMETDVLAIGGGGAGLAAAASATEQGAKVIVAAKCNSLGDEAETMIIPMVETPPSSPWQILRMSNR